MAGRLVGLQAANIWGGGGGGRCTTTAASSTAATAAEVTARWGGGEGLHQSAEALPYLVDSGRWRSWSRRREKVADPGPGACHKTAERDNGRGVAVVTTMYAWHND